VSRAPGRSRPAALLAAALLAATTTLTLALTLALGTGAHATTDDVAPTTVLPTTVPSAPDDEPVTTANPFLPDEQNLTDCVGLVERPGCGSESRGGLHQNLVAIVMVAGLLVVFGRVAWVVRRSHQRAADADTSPTAP
jgi:hypothetical protein